MLLLYLLSAAVLRTMTLKSDHKLFRAHKSTDDSLQAQSQPIFSQSANAEKRRPFTFTPCGCATVANREEKVCGKGRLLGSRVSKLHMALGLLFFYFDSVFPQSPVPQYKTLNAPTPKRLRFLVYPCLIHVRILQSLQYSGSGLVPIAFAN